MSQICSIENCNKKISARGWCAAHYRNWQRHGNPIYVRQYKKDEKCEAPNCERKQKTGGYCNTHYTKVRRSGTLEPIRETKEYKERWLDSRITELSKIDQIKDPNPKRRGFYATNIVSDLQQKARQRGIEWTLEKIETYHLIISNCYYCGFKPNWPDSRCGIDRVDNFRGYHKDNVVPCCYPCNTAKGTRTSKEFIEWAFRVHKLHPI